MAATKTTASSAKKNHLRKKSSAQASFRQISKTGSDTQENR